MPKRTRDREGTEQHERQNHRKPHLSLVIFGAFYDSLGVSEVRCIPLGVLGIDTAGTIKFLEKLSSADRQKSIAAKRQELDAYMIDKIIELRDSQFVIPGLVDTHIHAPQYVFTGTGYDMTLLKWLETYTFPRESAFKSLDYASRNYAKVVRKSIKCGTTTACYYATTHLEGSLVLARTVAMYGQRAFVGKVNMDRHAPNYYTETTESSIKDTISFISRLEKEIDTDLVTPVLTPRFVPNCTPELMGKLAEIAKKQNLPIQSHLSETPSELDWVAELHPDHEYYAQVYDHYGLLTDKTVMAHCVHLSQLERELLLERKVGISHCPSSNFCLHSGTLNVRRLLLEGHTKVGLGTDVAGGYSPSIMDAMRQAIIASKVVHVQAREEHATETYEPLGYSEAFYLATLGGARCMDLQDKIGNFMPGKQFDALVVDTSVDIGPLINDTAHEDETYHVDARCSNIDLFEHDDEMTRFEKFVYLGDDRNIKHIYVSGKQIA